LKRLDLEIKASGYLAKEAQDINDFDILEGF
jgi:hypothetical protein